MKEEIDWPDINFIKSTFPLYEALCEAFFLKRDTRASELYSTLRDATQQKLPILRDHIGDALPLLLFRVDVDEVRSERRAWYRACGSDLALLDFAKAARQYGREDFLAGLVQEGLSSPRYHDKAKAISLAGWCGTAPELRSLLEDLPPEPESWFDWLKEHALSRIRKEDWTRSWLEKFLSARSLAESFAGFRLFLHCVDRRYYAWSDQVTAAVAKTGITVQRRLRFLRTNHREVDKAIQTNEKSLDKYFLSLPIPGERLSPWAGLPPTRMSTPRK